MKKGKRTVFFIFLLLLIAAFLYLFMLINIMDLMQNVKDVFLWKYPSEETKGSAIDRYNYNGCFGNIQLNNAKLQLFPLFVFHNFRDGYVWAFYSYEAYDVDGNLITASLNVVTKWKIHKDNGKWTIVEISEKP